MNAVSVVRQLRSFMQVQGYSESALARMAGIPQSTVHRALRKPIRLTRTHHALCKIAGIDFSARQGPHDARDELVQEVLDIWDGSREHAHSLVRLLRAAGALQAYGATQPARTR
jgi:hypothetical protein